ncbi:34989_t:CDS:2, partial [Racocetra persica]
YYANTSAQLSSASMDYFSKIDCILKKYFTIEMLLRQRHEIIQSLYYYVITENREMPNDKHAEESYDTQQIHLDSLLKDLLPNNIIKIYKIQRHHCVHINYVIILADRSYLCTYMLLVNSGLYNNEKMQDLYLDEQPYMTNVGPVPLYE